jgi:hypothetical protein
LRPLAVVGRQLVLVALPVAVVLGGGLSDTSAAFHSADAAAVAMVARDALVAAQTAANPPVALSAAPVGASVIEQMRSAAFASLQQHYAGRELTTLMSVVDEHLDADAGSDIRYLGAGVASFTVTQMSLSGDKAEVVADAELWAEVAQVQGAKLVTANPSGHSIFTFELSRIDGVWMVVGQSSAFPNGASGP